MKKSISNNIVSKAVINSHVKRFMPIIFLGMAYLFFLYVFPAFFAADVKLLLRNGLNYNMIGIRFYCAGMPLIVSLALFNFLHKKNAVLFHHSIPIKRSQMYLSLVLSGLILINTPLIIFGVYVSAILNIATAFKVIAFGFIASTFVFSVCTLAAIITGTTVMHFIVACWFNFLPQSVYFVLTSFGEGLLNGYTNVNAMNYIMIMSPETHHFDLVSYKSLVYLAVATLIFVFGWVLYKKLKLERAENAIVFTSLKIILNIVVSVYFMALLGLVVYSFNNTTASFIIGSCIGAILGVYLGYMIFNKTFKIFNGKTLKLAIVLVIVSMILSLAYVFDIFGYENKIPNINEVKSVKVETSQLDRSSSYSNDEKIFKSRDNISNLIKIHNRCITLGRGNIHAEDYGYLMISYKLKNGDVLQREYYVPNEDEVLTKHYEYIFDSKEFKDNLLLEFILPSIDHMEVSNFETGVSLIFSGKEKMELAQALDKDLVNMKYKEIKNAESKYNLDVYDKKNEQFRNITIYDVDKNAVKYIESKMR